MLVRVVASNPRLPRQDAVSQVISRATKTNKRNCTATARVGMEKEKCRRQEEVQQGRARENCGENASADTVKPGAEQHGYQEQRKEIRIEQRP